MRKLLLILWPLLFSNFIQAQCPKPALCTPGGPTDPNAPIFQMGIRNVTLGSINKNTGFINSASSVSYHDYSCTDSTNVTVGLSVPISITTNGPGLSSENVKVWIDLNNDGAFDVTGELVFEALNDNNNVHTGSIVLPATTALDTALRMRVAAEWTGATNPTPDPCADRLFSEVEDYKIVALQNTSPPVASFDADPKESCDGIVQFMDLSSNGPSSWLWKFGDGTTDTVQNPIHTYLTNDTFDVTLIVTNANGTDSTTLTDLIIRNGIKPVSAICSPFTNAYCCGYGVTRVIFGDIDNSSADASVGYEDFTCLEYTEVTEGLVVPITINTNTTQNEDVKVYLDLNSDGDFDDPGETLLEELNTSSPVSQSIIIPSAVAPYSQPLRMRVMTDAVGNVFNSCTNLQRGQAEDYTVIVNPNPFPPVAVFSDDQANSCQDSINFIDQSLNAPFSWKWYFGDGNTDTIQNPSHTYTSYGTYNVSLVVCNNIGCDSTARTFSYNVGAAAPACVTTTLISLVANNITNFNLGSINNSSPGNNAPSNEDFACESFTDLIQGQSHPVTIQSSQTQGSFWYRVFIDFNDDSFFGSNEVVFAGTGAGTINGNVTIPLTGNILIDQPLRLRVATDVTSSGVQPCGTLFRGQTEDYTVFIRAPQAPPVASFDVNDTVSCSGSIKFTDQSGFSPTGWIWRFGDGQTSTMQNPEHDYQDMGSYTVTLVACNQWGCDSTTKSITVSGLFGAKLAECAPTSLNISPNGIRNVTIENINNHTLADVGYSDFSCDKVAYLNAGVANVLNVETQSGITHKVGAWIDYNNNGSFTSNEKVMTSSANGSHMTAIIIPASAIRGKVLRLRIMAEVDFLNPPDPEPCTDLINGETEDYGVYIGESNSLPVAFFESNQTVSCNGQVAFQNFSFPNATAFEWNFGDGATSTDEHPVHQYASAGTYDVTLIAKNGFGEDTLIKEDYIQVTGTTSLPLADCYPITQFSNEDFGIFRFDLEGISNLNSIASGYEDYTCSDTTTLLEGEPYGFLINTGPEYFGRASIYLDYNNDGDFDDLGENVWNGTNTTDNHLGNFTVPGNVSAESQFIRLRVVATIAGSPVPGPCIDPEYGQVEDYSVFISPSGVNDIIKSMVNVYPNPVNENLFIEAPMDWELDIRLLDSRGVVVLDFSNQAGNKIDLSNVEAGYYLLEVSNGEASGFFKLIVK